MSPAPRRPARGRGSRAPYGRTWWGSAWVEALEQRARLDPNRLPRGRTYARHARVGAVTVDPGEIRAPVLGSRSSAYRVRVRVRPFTPAEWDTALEAITARAGHAAALLEGELTPAIVDDLAEAGLDLLPGPGEVATSCSCPDWANPCKHAAAVCYLIADLLDDDPFTLLALRGRARDEVLAGLRARRAAGSAGPTTTPSATDAGVSARDVWTTTAQPPLPRPPSPPEHAGRPAPVALDPPSASGLRLDQVVALAADAAARAWELASGAGDGGLGLDPPADLARRAATSLGTSAFGELAAHSGVRPRPLVALATAWEHGGPGAVAVLADDRPPPATSAVEQARAALVGAGYRIRSSPEGDLTIVGAGARLRCGDDGLWYRLERRAGTWEVTAAGDDDPVALADDLADPA